MGLSLDVLLQTLLSAVLAGCVYALVTMGFTLIFGVMDITNFAHGNLVMASMFTTLLLNKRFHMDPFLSLIIVVPLFFGIGLLIHQGVFRRILDAPHATHIMVTMGLMLLLENGANLLFSADMQSAKTSYTSASLPLGSISLQVARAGAAAVSLACVIALALFLKRSDFGKSIRAAASNRLGANLCGINVSRVYLISVGIATAAAAVAGAVMMPYYLVSPISGHEFLNKAFAISVVGGMGSFAGAFVASILIALVEAFGGILFKPELTNALVFGLLILVLLFKPSGLMGRIQQ